MKCTLKPGDRMSQGNVYRITPDDAHVRVEVESLLKDKRVVIYGGPAPFSRLDTRQTLEYAKLGDRILKHVDVIYGIYCQDAFVLRQFDKHIAESYPSHPVTLYADGDAFFIRNYGLEHDFTHQGLSVRSGRYAFVVNNCIVEHVALDNYTDIGSSGAGEILAWLESN